jgi:hypothetical protein
MVPSHPLCGLNLPQDVSDAELAADPFMSTGWPLYVKLELRAMTKSQRMRESAVMISSTMPSAKILLLGVSAYIGERQHCDRRLMGQCQHRAGQCGRIARRADPVDPHWPYNVLELLLPDVFESEIEPACGILLRPRRDTDAAGLS